ncbi:response regulator [Geminocystis sp. GBBB08]|uniref:response regulator n=1 Tax=Geminocystis sp. GBBB08 TaxID=2604140 RepID=UPI0027E325C6|nr:response regulator [Geminocystis sp. GBBB08]MBL1208820.1 response regulator [Geminocystis sp. GBBB08]
MNKKLKSVNLFNDIAKLNGKVEITHNSVVWQLFLVEGKLESANHSLQSEQTIKYYLRSLGYHDIEEIDLLKEKTSHKSKHQVKNLINRLEKLGYLNSKQRLILTKKITEDALEPLFWLTQDENELIPVQQSASLTFEENLAISEHHLLEIQPLIKNIHQRWQLWQKLYPLIVSPHQRPSCANPSLLEKSISSGNLSVQVLKQLVQLMNGLSIRELAFMIKQDELKLAQLLSTYITGGILKLYPPKSPFNLLPHIPPLITEKSPINETQINQIITQENKPIQKKYNIVCIDDSPAMLEIISSYLDSHKYHLIAIADPMKSLSYMFKSNPDLIIMDISMPGINGNRLCQILKSSSIFKSVPIILISGETNIQADILESTGARDFLPKPFEKQTLINLIHKYC